MKLQIAFDFGVLDDLIELAKRFGDDVDWIEVGTYLILQESIRAVSAFKHALPGKMIVADLKIVDAGAEEARLAFDAGADIVTVLGCAYDATIVGATRQAHAQQGRVMVDLMGVDDKPRRAQEVAAMGVDLVCLHVGWDENQPDNDPLADLIAVKQATNAPLTVAGGMTVERLADVSRHGAHAVIVGRTVMLAPDPVAMAHQFRARMLELDSERGLQ